MRMPCIALAAAAKASLPKGSRPAPSWGLIRAALPPQPAWNAGKIGVWLAGWDLRALVRAGFSFIAREIDHAKAHQAASIRIARHIHRLDHARRRGPVLRRADLAGFRRQLRHPVHRAEG